MNETITLHSGVISVNGEPFLRFHSSAVAGIFLMRLGYRCTLTDEQTYAFQK